jgi:hypothetical protein
MDFAKKYKPRFMYEPTDLKRKAKLDRLANRILRQIQQVEQVA